MLEANKGAVSAVAFAPDGALLAAGDASVLPSRDPALLLTRGVACRAPARSSFMTLKHVVYALAPCHSPGAQFDRLPPTGSLPSRGGRTTARACTVSRGRPTGRTSRPGPWTPTCTCGVSRRYAASGLFVRNADGNAYACALLLMRTAAENYRYQERRTRRGVGRALAAGGAGWGGQPRERGC